MCGIAGLMTRDGRPPDGRALDALAAALGHRGPDGHGRHVAGGVGLVHARLAIIAVETGAQPLFGAGGTALVANGEIYNYRELLAGALSRTGSDCEAPLALYARDGLDFCRPMRGMYALALHDPARRRLVLARDPFGIKPLYWADTPAGFAFASEPQALLAAGLVPPAVDAAARDQFLQLQFAGDCPLGGIHRVRPGEVLAIESGCIVERRVLPALPAAAPEPVGEADALRTLDRVLMETVELHQRSDVPYGMFLSGGIDSASLLALMKRTNERPVLAFTAHFPDAGGRDESLHAAMLAKATGAEHVTVPFTEQDFWALLPEVAAALDDPIADYAALPTWKLARVASAQVKVILSGEGGDEMFAGYGRYRSAVRPWPFARVMRRRGTFDRLGILRREPAGWRGPLDQCEAAMSRAYSRLQRVQAVDAATWLPDNLLIKLDRCLMAHGVEGRVPLVDRAVAAFAFRLPDRLKLGGGMGKWLLRQWLAQALPQAEPFSPKRGFTVPVGEWLSRRPELGALLERDPAIAEICRPGAAASLFHGLDKRRAFAAWTLLVYALWHRRHVRRLAPAGGVFDSLAAAA